MNNNEYDFTDAPNIRLAATFTVCITVSPYSGPITADVVCQNAAAVMRDMGLTELLEKVEILDVCDCQDNSFLHVPVGV